mgnify:FL=1
MMLRVTECDRNGQEYGFEVFDIHTPREAEEAMKNFRNKYLLWTNVNGERRYPANANTTELSCESPQFERTTMGDYCDTCHWVKELHA